MYHWKPVTTGNTRMAKDIKAIKKPAQQPQKQKTPKRQKTANQNAAHPTSKTNPLRRNAAWILVGAVAFIWMLTHWLEPEFAWMAGGLAVLLGVICYDIYARRKWENVMADNIFRLASDYERLVREVARNRNDVASLKKGLVDAGNAAQILNRGASAESRMLQTVMDKLSAVGGSPRADSEEDIPEPQIPPIGPVPAGRDEGEFTAAHLDKDTMLGLIRHAVRYDRVEMFMQPVVALPQRKTRFYEVFSRIRVRPGVYLPAGRYISVAAEHDLVAAVDNLLLLRCLQLIRDMERDQRGESFFVNIAGVTLNDSKFMGDLVEFLSQHKALAPRLIFELTEADLDMLGANVLPILDGLSKLGCRFSVDQLQSLSVDLKAFGARHIRYVKLHADLLLKAMAKPGGLRRLKSMKQDLDSQGIDLIVEKIEHEKDLVELLDVEIDFGQGYLFGRPEINEEAA